MVALSFFSGIEASSGLGCVRLMCSKVVEDWERWVEDLSLLREAEFLAGNLKTFRN